MKILAVSGSLRQASINTMLLRAAAQLAPPGVALVLYTRLGDIPLFNADLEGREPPSVREWWRAVGDADGLLIASPEYAHGVTGVMKNALDWAVGDEGFVDKPVALFNASPRAHHAQAALREIVTVMSARLVEAASITVPLLGRGADETVVLEDADLSGRVREALAVFVEAIRRHAAEA